MTNVEKNRHVRRAVNRSVRSASSESGTSCRSGGGSEISRVRTGAISHSAVAGTSVLVDGQTTKGVELDMSGQVTPAWSVMGGYAYQDSVFPEKSGSIKAGTVSAQVPTNTFSLWNRYDVTPALGAGLGVVYRDSIFTGTSNAVTLPSFTRVDAAVFYTVNKNYRLQANLENLFDKEYFSSAHSDSNIMPGSPRALRVTLNATF